jgi:predicted GIY-YIG superfamily endonuclease
MMGVYLIHMEAPISPDHTTQHYIGFAEEIAARLEAHAAGRGARLMEVAKERGIHWHCARVWEGASRKEERKLKNRKNAPELCPECNPRAERNGKGIGKKSIIHPQIEIRIAVRVAPVEVEEEDYPF